MVSKVVTTDFPFVVFSQEADIDYLLARWIHFAGGIFCARAGFFAQQASEMYMKALMVQEDNTYIETHKLLDLAVRCSKYDTYFSEALTTEILQAFDVFDQVGRYGAAAKFDPLAQTDEDVETAGAWMWNYELLDRLDGFVFKVRSFLDFTGVHFPDLLKQVQKKDRKNMLSQLWAGRPPLRVVLTKQNRYFQP